MKLKSTLLALGALSLAGFTAGAEAAADVCAMSIEGADISMSKDEVADAWTAAGYTQHVPNHVRPETPPSLTFSTQGEPVGQSFITNLNWGGASHGKPGNSINVTYAAPSDPALMPAYDTFQREIITDFCTKYLPALRAVKAAEAPSRANPRMARGRDERLSGVCERAVLGEFSPNADGIIELPIGAFSPTIENGCAFGVVNARAGRGSKGGLNVSILGSGSSN